MNGVDAHKRRHTLVAMEQIGRTLGETAAATTSEDHLTTFSGLGSGRGARFAVEDCQHVTRLLERDLLAAGASQTGVDALPVVGEPEVVAVLLVVPLLAGEGGSYQLEDI